jgi:prepilin-type N-terminal cleavage/methylation domain-containing protein
MHNTLKRLQARGGSGFTLIELLVVIAILAILAGVVVFAVGNSTKNAEVASCKTERGSIVTAWNAAYTGRQIDGNTDVWTEYLPQDVNAIKYFDTPTNDGADRKAGTETKAAVAKCTAIGPNELQDITP